MRGGLGTPFAAIRVCARGAVCRMPVRCRMPAQRDALERLESRDLSGRLLHLATDPARGRAMRVLAVYPRNELLKDQLSATLREVRRRALAEPDVSDMVCATHGNAVSIYFRAPEGNRLEFFVDAPWYVKQPVVAKLDLSLSDEQIFEFTRTKWGVEDTFQPMSAWNCVTPTSER